MMLGYWNRPEANAELLLPGGWFRTGDIARKDSDGLHYYIGRTATLSGAAGRTSPQPKWSSSFWQCPR
jgi:long-subunit acyl-CoA synthetase (AMP-forming)